MAEHPVRTDLDFLNASRVLNLPDPTLAQHAATKAYVDSIAVNLGKRARVRAATTANITISTALNNGDSIDGVTLATGDLVLVKDQSTAAQNGVYTVGTAPARAAEFDTYDEHPGSLISVAEGTINADTIWLCTSNEGGALGTTAIDFSAVLFLVANSVTDTILRDSIALSVIGRSVNSTGDPGDIQAGTDGHVLRRSGTTLEFGLLAAGAFATAPGIVTPAMMDNGAAASLLGRSANSTGARADIASSADGQVLRRAAGALGFGAVDLADADAVTGVLPAANLPDSSTTAEGISEQATAAEYRTGSDTTRHLGVAETWSAAALATLTDATTITVDLNAGFNFGGASNAVLALAGNRTLGAPSNGKPGQTGVLWFGASTSTRTLTLNASWLMIDGVEAGPYSITTAQILGLCYWVRTSGNVYVTAILRRAA